MTFHDLFDFETTVDAGAGDGAAAVADTGSVSDGGTNGDGGQGGATAAAGAAAAVATDTGDGVTPAPAPFNFQEWASTPEGQQQLGQTFSSWAEQQQAERAAAEAAAARATENPYADIEEGLGLLGIDPSRFKEYMGAANQPIMDVVEKVQQQEAVAWVDSQLTELGTAHPDLLGDGIDKLAELVNDDGTQLFNPQEVKAANREAVLLAASAIQNASIDPRTGQSTVDHQTALKLGVDQVSKRDAIISKIAQEKLIRDLEHRGTAPQTVSTGTAGGERLGAVAGDELAIARRFNAERT